jgi:predicted double-glycine peptidase
VSLHSRSGHAGAAAIMRWLLGVMACAVFSASCGAAALATLLNYQHGHAVSEKSVAEAMLRRNDPLKVKTRGGFSLLDMKRFADTRGFEGVGYMDLELEDLIDLGPAIVPVQFRGYPHFVVVRGISQHKVLLADPAFGNRTVDLPAFLRSWQPKVGFVVRPRDGASSPPWPAERPTDDLRPANAAVRSALR